VIALRTAGAPKSGRLGLRPAKRFSPVYPGSAARKTISNPFAIPRRKGPAATAPANSEADRTAEPLPLARPGPVVSLH